MNRIYKIVWHGSLGCWIAASELAKASGKKGKKKLWVYRLIIGLFLSGIVFGSYAANSGQRIEAANGALVIDGGVPESASTKTDATGHMGKGGAQGKTLAGVAIGSRAQGYFGSVAIGDDPSANSVYGVAIGSGVSIDRRGSGDADSDVGRTFGDKDTKGPSERAVSIGSGVWVKQSFGGISVGNEASVNNSTKGIAIGNGAKVDSSVGSVAIGSEARVDGFANSVALGSGSIVHQDKTVSIGTLTNPRKLTSLAKGTVSNSSTEAVNGSQFFQLEQEVTKNANSIRTHRSEVDSGLFGIVQQDVITQEITVAGRKTGRQVSLLGTSGTRKLTGVMEGILNANSSDAVNGSQLFATNGEVTKNTRSITQNAADVSTLTTNINAGSVGLVRQNPSSKAVTVAATSAGNQISFAGTAGSRMLTGVGEGVLSVSSTDAVNGSQLFSTNTAVTINTEGIERNTLEVKKNTARSRTNSDTILDNASSIRLNNDAVSQLKVDIGKGAIGLVQQTPVTGVITVAADSGGDNISLKGKTGERRLSGIKAGELSTVSTDAVSGSQLFATDTNVTGNLNNIRRLISNLHQGAIGLVQQDGTTKVVTVAATQAGNQVSFAGSAGTRKLTGVTQGDITADSSDAINGAQLFTTNKNIVKNSDDIAKSTKDIVESAQKITENVNTISKLTRDISQGTIGLVLQDPSSKAITVAADSAGTQISFTSNTGAARTLSGIKAGTLSISSSDAVNGAQLFATNENVTRNVRDIGEGAKKITENAAAVSTLTNNISQGAIGLVRQDPLSNVITIAADRAGEQVSFAGNAGVARRLNGLKSAELSTSSSDAVNGAQLFATNENVAKNSQSVAKNISDITQHEGKIAQNSADIRSNASGITQNADKITQHEGKTAQNSADIRSNASGITQNADKITQHEGKIAQNSTDIRLNASGITQNADKITQHEGKIAQNSTDIRSNTSGITQNTGEIRTLTNNISQGSIGLVQQDTPTNTITVAATNSGDKVSIVGTSGVRTLNGLKDGELSASSSDAVNGSQLFATNTDIAKNADDINKFSNSVIKGASGLVRQKSPTDIITVASESAGDQVSLAGKTGSRKLSDLKDGVLSIDSSDAVNGSQLFTVNQNVAKNTGNIVQNAADIVENAGKIVQNSESISKLTTDISEGVVGLVQQNSPIATITVAAMKGGEQISFAGQSGSRILTRVKRGALSTTSTDAINGSQLLTTNNEVEKNADGIEQLREEIMNGSIGLLLDNPKHGGWSTDSNSTRKTRSITLAAGHVAEEVSIEGKNGERRLIGVAPGELSPTSVDAVNGSQLLKTNNELMQNANNIAAIANSFGGGAMIDPTEDKFVSPSYIVQNREVNNVGDALSMLNDVVVLNSSDIAALKAGRNKYPSNTMTQLVREDASSKKITVGKLTGGKSVDITGTEGVRRISGVKAGVADNDAVNLEQLNKTLADMRSANDHSVNRAIKKLDNRLDQVKNKLTAGIASSMAMAGIPQAYVPDSSLLGAAVASYRGGSAIAIGVSTVSESGKWITKLQSSNNTQKDFGVSLGIGYQW
ncbi:ESPR-type extended signal peptide-containing protein [Candidatus Fukatsuia symbiotica]|uniref:ESPR-type extended signal peptide-containing protein n=1 Tax=Candidatus Fukatsuia symbiotica TaxID=1878942 RepID=UPI0009342C05|nr:ESPR-type extended signal peptide-containing protein [Candidatus Fukatsuia symbiotica]